MNSLTYSFIPCNSVLIVIYQAVFAKYVWKG